MGRRSKQKPRAILLLEEAIESGNYSNFISFIKTIPKVQFHHSTKFNAKYPKGCLLHALFSLGNTAMIEQSNFNTQAYSECILKCIDLMKLDIDNVDTIDGDGNSFLHHAVCTGQQDIVNKLLECGAQPNMKNNQGVTPLMIINLPLFRSPELEKILLSAMNYSVNGIEIGVGSTISSFKKQKKIQLIENGPLTPLEEKQRHTAIELIESAMYFENPMMAQHFKGKIADLYKHPTLKIILDIAALTVLGNPANKSNEELIEKYDDLLQNSELSKDEEDLIKEQLEYTKHKIIKYNKRLKIFFMDDTTTHQIDPLAENTLGHYKQGYSIYIGNNENTTKTMGIFIHELTHFVTNIVFNNKCHPYISSNAKLWNDIPVSLKRDLTRMKFLVLTEQITDWNALDVLAWDTLMDIYSNYSSGQHDSELVVRIPQLLVEMGYDRGIAWLQEYTPQVWDFYQSNFLEKLEQYCIENSLTEKVLTRNIIDDSQKENFKPFPLLSLADKSTFFSSVKPMVKSFEADLPTEDDVEYFSCEEEAPTYEGNTHKADDKPNEQTPSISWCTLL